MTQQWSDDFNRPDGAIGNGWSTSGAGVVVESNMARASNNRRAYRTPWSRAQLQRVRLDLTYASGVASWGYALVRWDDALQNGYQVTISHGGTTGTITVYKTTGGGTSIIFSQSRTVNSGIVHTLECVDNNGVLALSLDGVSFGTVNDATYTNNAGCGFRVPTAFSRVDNFYTDDIPAQSFDAEPEPLVAMAEPQGLTFTGTGTAWTPGTPGTPTFTVDKGTLANQSVQDATHATADYTPPQADDIATFTDPSTGQTDAVALSTGFQVEAGGDVTEVLTRIGEQVNGDTVLGQLRHVRLNTDHPEWGTDHNNFLTQLMDIDIELPWKELDFPIKFHWEMAEKPGVYNETLLAAIMAMLGNVLGAAQHAGTILDNMETPAHYSLLDVMTGIKGVSNFDLSEIADLISNLPPLQVEEITSYLDWITSTRGYNLEWLSLGIGNLDTKMDAQHLEVVDFLNWLTEDQTLNLDILEDQILANRTEITAARDGVYSRLDVMTSNGENTLQTILDALSQEMDELGQDVDDVHADLTSLRSDELTHYGDLHGHVTDVANKVNGIDTNVQQIHQHVESLHNTDLSAIVTQLNRIEQKIDALGTGSASRVRPVWPGLAGVALGAQQPLAPTVTINGTLDGLVLHVESSAPSVGSKVWDGTRSFYKLGYVSFRSDRGDYEPLQPILFRDSLLAPTTMQHASGCAIITRSGTVGTVQPWTLASP